MQLVDVIVLPGLLVGIVRYLSYETLHVNGTKQQLFHLKIILPGVMIMILFGMVKNYPQYFIEQ